MWKLSVSKTTEIHFIPKFNTIYNCVCYKWTCFFGHFVTYDKPKTRYEINKNLRKFNKNHNTTMICARFVEIFVLLIKHKGTGDTLHFFQ